MRVRRSLRSARIGAALAIASAALVACNLITGLDADYSSTAHDGATAPVGEGGPDAPGKDGEGTDGSTATDGMVSGDAGDGGLVSEFCAKVKDGSADRDFFCTDFEHEVLPGDGAAPLPWNALVNAGGAGTISFVDAGGSRVLEVSGVTAGGTPANAYLEVALEATMQANTYSKYELDFDFEVVQSNLDYDAYGLLIFKPFDGTQENGIAGYGPASPHRLSHQGTGVSPVLYVPNSVPAWRHAAITLTHVDGGSYSRTIHIGSTDVDENKTGHVIPLSAPTELWMGVFNTDSTSGVAVAQFDNVVLRRTP